MTLASVSHDNAFSFSSSSIFTSNFCHSLNPNFTKNLQSSRECVNNSRSIFRCGNKHRFLQSDGNHVVRDRKTLTVTPASLGGLLGGIFKGGADTDESTRQQ
ncbi:hypothetical protein HanRHA438_Chr11g0516471 [Helianthus annuus]|nr:hypothetical protein HanIR_Chr11g0542331 [Helianthus annuus]KAJ0871793.1 hypothetical protein HanRHA438_Chr11g0516471 [Helianthus annuus]